MLQETTVTFTSNITGKFFDKTFSHCDSAELREFTQNQCTALNAIAIIGDTVIEP